MWAMYQNATRVLVCSASHSLQFNSLIYLFLSLCACLKIMGACCCKNGDGIEGLRCKEEEEEEEEEEHDDDRLKFHYNFDNDDEGKDGGMRAGEGGARVRLKGSCGFASMYSQQGWKGANQDAMTIWEDFGGASDKIFCGVFDGHGPLGHRVACYARDRLPSKLSSVLDSLPELQGDFDSNGSDDDSANTEEFSSWKDAFLKVFEELDKELRNHSTIDCICSGSTAVSIVKQVVKQSEHLIIANLGDSRAILGTRDDKNKLIAVQLTIDLKPNLPNEAERIRNCRGRVFALDVEPDVHRIWMPDDNCPGLAMARSFGDFCLKDFGLISTPQVCCRKISDRDEFVVLATDGVWDVLTNKEVVKIVSSTGRRSDAAKHVVDRAVRAWHTKHPTSKVDDCTVVCVFVKHPMMSMARSVDARSHRERSCEPSFSESFRTARSGNVSDTDEVATTKEWTALEGIS